DDWCWRNLWGNRHGDASVGDPRAIWLEIARSAVFRTVPHNERITYVFNTRPSCRFVAPVVPAQDAAVFRVLSEQAQNRRRKIARAGLFRQHGVEARIDRIATIARRERRGDERDQHSPAEERRRA